MLSPRHSTLDTRHSSDLLGLTSDQLAQAATLALPSGAGIAARLYPELMRGVFDPEAHRVSATSAAAWRAAFHLTLPTVARLAEETTPDGLITSKVVWRLHDGREIETVRIPMGVGADTSYTLCLSSQVGCKMACSFCETGLMGLVRQLTAGEIVAQVVAARALLGWEARNLVFMGMGEALDNADHLLQALHIFTDKRGMHYSQERLTICTAGHAEGLAKLTALGWKRLNLSISLNATTDALRDSMMPVNRRTPLASLQALLAAYPQRRNFTLGVNYCLMPGLNDTREDSQRIAAFCAPLGRVLINLIPYNPGSRPLTRAPAEDEVEGFIAWLREDGLPVRRRVTKGRSIMAACGQLGDPSARKAR